MVLFYLKDLFCNLRYTHSNVLCLFLKNIFVFAPIVIGTISRIATIARIIFRTQTTSKTASCDS